MLNDELKSDDDGMELLGNWIAPPSPFPSRFEPKDAPDTLARALNSPIKTPVNPIGAEALNCLRGFVERWITSGKDGVIERPYERNLGLPPRQTDREMLERGIEFKPYPRDSEPLIGAVQAYLLGARPFVDFQGEVEYRREPNHVDPAELAMSVFFAFLKSPVRSRLFRCDLCNRFYVLERNPRKELQHGSFCPDHRESTKAKNNRNQATIKKQRRILVRQAAKWLLRCSPELQGRSRSKWVFDQMKNEGLPRWCDNTARWVTTYMRDIEAEAQRIVRGETC